MNCILENTSVLPSSNFVDFIHRASRMCLGQSAKALVWRWRQISPLKINIFTLSAPISTNEVSMFKLAIEVCFENHFGLIHAVCLSLGSTKSGYFFLGHPVLFLIQEYIKTENFRTIKLSDKDFSESLFVRNLVMSKSFKFIEIEMHTQTSHKC